MLIEASCHFFSRKPVVTVNNLLSPVDAVFVHSQDGSCVLHKIAVQTVLRLF